MNGVMMWRDYLIERISSRKGDLNREASDYVKFVIELANDLDESLHHISLYDVLDFVSGNERSDLMKAIEKINSHIKSEVK